MESICEYKEIFREGRGECKEEKSRIQFWICAHVHVFV